MKQVTVTYLEMRSPLELKPKLAPDGHFQIREAAVKQWELNRFLYHLVGANWSWTDKRAWSDQKWRDYAEADELRTFTACYQGALAGYFEMRPDHLGGSEIAILGLAPKFIGQGLGGALVTRALEEAWKTQPNRVWLHTCTLDHPSALSNYQARGMRIYRVETVGVA